MSYLFALGSMPYPGEPIASPSVPYLYSGCEDFDNNSSLSASVKFGVYPN